MRIVKLMYVLYKIKLLSPLGVYRLFFSIFKYGINLLALLHFAKRNYSNSIALIDGMEKSTYEQLWSNTEQLAIFLKEQYQLKSGHKVGILCKNHAGLVKSIFAISGLGADLYLLNAEMSQNQFNCLLDQHNFHLLIYDVELSTLINQSNYSKAKIISYHDQLPAINNLLRTDVTNNKQLPRTSMSKLVILTGGTTGNAKAAAHKASVFNYLNPFIAFVTKLRISDYKTAYIATPIYHGYGVAVLLLCVAMGKRVVIHKGFDAQIACELIRQHQVEMITVVPLMLHKMLRHNVENLQSLSCIASGGAEINPKLVEETRLKLGDVLYNLYGTSEAGLNIMATPQDLRYSTKTIGRLLDGVHLKIVDDQKNEVQIGKVGQFCIINEWSMSNRQQSWIETGDVGYQDLQGFYYLCGRVDDMIVSAGENVYPVDVERILLQHPLVEDVAVIGIPDEMFGQRLKAYVQLEEGKHTNPEKTEITQDELIEWLRPRVARFQLPKEITFVDYMPYTSIGKLDKKRLRELNIL